MVKRIACTAIAICVCTFLFAQTIALDDVPPEIKNVLQKKQLVVAMTAADQYPFYYVNSAGELTGFDVFLAKSIADALGVELVVTRDAPSFNDVVSLVAAKKADIAISKLSRTLPRAKYILYTQPYIVFKQALLFNRLQLAKYTSEANLKSFIRDFRGKLGVISASSYVGYAKTNFPNADVVEYGSWDEVVAAVIDGKVLAAFRDELEVTKVMQSIPNAGLTLKPVFFADMTDPIAMAVRYDNLQLLSWLNIFLDSLSLDLNSEKILAEYGGN